MKEINKISNIVIVFVVSILIGVLIQNIFEVKNQKEVVQEVKKDTLPLKNQGEVIVQIIDNKKIITISLEDFQYITKKRSVTKKVVKNIEALFARLED